MIPIKTKTQTLFMLSYDLMVVVVVFCSFSNQDTINNNSLSKKESCKDGRSASPRITGLLRHTHNMNYNAW